jgi:hypothetical protein
MRSHTHRSPHITLSHTTAVGAVYSNTLLAKGPTSPVDPPLVLTGRVGVAAMAGAEPVFDDKAVLSLIEQLPQPAGPASSDITTLNIFDFDATLADSPDKQRGHAAYARFHGRPFPQRSGWVVDPESLRHPQVREGVWRWV